jgi:hypothetical protein
VSLIWEQLRGSEKFARHTPSLESWGAKEGPRLFSLRAAERRKSDRADIYVPLFVYGYTYGREPFHEDTNSLEISNNGGLLRLDAPVSRGQRLLLQNKVSKQELACTVVRVEKQFKRTYVGVAFAESDGGFWQCRKQPDQHD